MHLQADGNHSRGRNRCFVRCNQDLHFVKCFQALSHIKPNPVALKDCRCFWWFDRVRRVTGHVHAIQLKFHASIRNFNGQQNGYRIVNPRRPVEPTKQPNGLRGCSRLRNRFGRRRRFQCRERQPAGLPFGACSRGGRIYRPPFPRPDQTDFVNAHARLFARRIRDSLLVQQQAQQELVRGNSPGLSAFCPAPTRKSCGCVDQQPEDFLHCGTARPVDQAADR